MTSNVLANLEFAKIIFESSAHTQTGAELINKYQTYLMANAESCDVVNKFVKEAVSCMYDNGVNDTLSRVTDYISSNKTSWALASACESIMANGSNFNMLNRNAAKQVEKLLEQDEENVIKYIRSGALKNVMFCESFRNIAKSVFAEKPIIEHKADYTKYTPCSIVEQVGDGLCFVVAGQLYKVDDGQHISEAQWNEVSNTFKTVASLLNSQLVEVDENKITIKYMNAEYIVESADHIVKKVGEDSREFTVEQFREHSRMQVLTANPRFRNNVAQVLESIAQLVENFDTVATLDNVGIYTTKNDKFVVIESGSDLYATLLASTKHPKWTINEDAISALSFIKTKTNTELGEEYKKAVEITMQNESKEHQEEIEKQLQLNEEQSIKERIEALTEKFSHDPAKLAILAKLASDIQGLN